MSDITPGTTLQHRRVVAGSETELWGDTIRFSAVVDNADGDYIEATPPQNASERCWVGLEPGAARRE